MKYNNNAIEYIIQFEKTKNLKETNYWIRFKETTLENPTNITDKAIFLFFFKIKEILIEGDLYHLFTVKTKTNNDLTKWLNAMIVLDKIKNSKLNIFVPSQLQYLIHLVCEVVNYIGQIDPVYLDYMFCDNLKKTPLTFWSYNPDFPLIMNKMILIVSFTSKEKDIVTKEYGKVQKTLSRFNVSEEQIKVFDTDWETDKAKFYGDIYGSLLSTDSSDDEIKSLKENTTNLKTFLKKNYKELYNNILKITDSKFISLMNSIYDHNFDYNFLTPSDIEYIREKQQEILIVTKNTADIVDSSSIVDLYHRTEIMAAEKMDSYIAAGSSAAAMVAGFIGIVIMIYREQLLYSAASAYIISATEAAGIDNLIPLIGAIISIAIIIIGFTLGAIFFAESRSNNKAITFLTHLNILTECEKARNEAFKDKDLDSLMMREIALFSALNKDPEAHEIHEPSPIQSGEFLDEVLYHGKPVKINDVYAEIKQILI